MRICKVLLAKPTRDSHVKTEATFYLEGKIVNISVQSFCILFGFGKLEQICEALTKHTRCHDINEQSFTVARTTGNHNDLISPTIHSEFTTSSQRPMVILLWKLIDSESAHLQEGETVPKTSDRAENNDCRLWRVHLDGWKSILPLQKQDSGFHYVRLCM